MTKKRKPDWFWISFADDSGFLGGCYVEADGPLHPLYPEKDEPCIRALGKSHVLGINPGGQAAMYGPLGRRETLKNVPAAYRNRLLTKGDLKQIGGYVKASGEDL